MSRRLLALPLLLLLAATARAAEAPDAVVARRLAEYEAAFPEIRFVHLHGGERWLADMQTFLGLLGEGARDRVYAHPPELAADLLEVSRHRVQRMLVHGLASASFYEVGEGSTAQRPYLCVLTLQAERIAGDDVEALAGMFSAPREQIRAMPAAARLDPHEHLLFVVDHEVFHCLDPYLIGPIPLSKRAHWGEYMFYRNEHGADAFAIARHMARRGGPDNYVDTIMRVRAASLTNRDPNHCTCESIRLVRAADPVHLAGLSLPELVHYADEVRRRGARDYEGYLDFRVAAHSACQAMGLEPRDERFSAEGPEGRRLDPALVNTLILRTRSCYKDLLGLPAGTEGGAGCGRLESPDRSGD